MADEKKKPDAAPAGGGHGDKGAATEKKDAGGKAAGGGLLAKTPVLIGGVMIIEAVVLFGGFKFLGSAPKPVQAEVTTEEGATAPEGEAAPAGGHGAEGAAATGEPKIDKKKTYEVEVVKDFKAPNRISGRNIVYDVAIVASVKGLHKEKVVATFKAHEGLIKDRVRTIIAQCEPEKLAEPGLETLRRQVKYQLDEILGPGLIEEVLVPRCIAFRSDF